MAMRYRKSINLGGGVRLNLGKKGVGVSVGGKRVRYSVNSSGRRTTTVRGPGCTGYQHTSSSSKRKPAVRSGGRSVDVAAPQVVRSPRPGLFASRDEKRLFKAMKVALAHTSVEQWAPQFEALAASEKVGVAARVLAGLLLFDHHPDQALAPLQEVQRSGVDPSADPFLRKYASTYNLTVSYAGLEVSLPLGRDLAAMTVMRLHEHCQEAALAGDAAEQMSDSKLGWVVKASAAVDNGRPQRAIDLTNGVTNTDDLATLAVVARAAAMRQLQHYDGALESLKEALRFPSRTAAVRHHARFERAMVYKAQGQLSKAKAELERIYAEDVTFPEVSSSLAELSAT
jgi:tetratricopeptide (TPR) repeat protein